MKPTGIDDPNYALITRNLAGDIVILPHDDIDWEYLKEAMDYMEKSIQDLCWILEAAKCPMMKKCYGKLVSYEAPSMALPYILFKDIYMECPSSFLWDVWMGVPQPFAERLDELRRILKEKEALK